MSDLLKKRKSIFQLMNGTDNASEDKDIDQTEDITDETVVDDVAPSKKTKLSNLGLFLSTALGALGGKASGIGSLAGAAKGIGDYGESVSKANTLYEKQNSEKLKQYNKLLTEEMKNKRQEEKDQSLQNYRKELIGLQRQRLAEQNKEKPTLFTKEDELAFSALDDADKDVVLNMNTNELLKKMAENDPVYSSAAKYIYNKKLQDKRLLSPSEELYSD